MYNQGMKDTCYSKKISIIAYIKLCILSGLLCWYRSYFDLDDSRTMSPLDDLINEIARIIDEDTEGDPDN